MFDGNGNWTSDFSAESDRDNNIKILASRFDNIFIADIKESFENCLTKDGQIAPIGAFTMGGQKITNLGNGTNPNDAVNVSQVDSKITTMLSTLFPVGSLYMGTQASCPLSSLIPGSTWTKVSGNRALWTSSTSHTANTTISAGLPNITGSFNTRSIAGASGAFDTSNTSPSSAGTGSSATQTYKVSFKASDSNSIYGNSITVQPPAYVVNVWRRTA